MLGCRALQPVEIERLKAHLSLRNRCILVLGIRTGFRIRELLSLQVSDVLDESGAIRDIIRVQRRNIKGKASGQGVSLHEDAKKTLREYLGEYMVNNDINAPLFRSNGNSSRGNRLHHSVFRKQLSEACSRASIRDQHLVSTHSLRKTYAANLYDFFKGDLFKLQRAMRHRSIQSTASYVSVDEDEVQNAIKGVK